MDTQPTPGRDRVVVVELGGRRWAFRRPSRADFREIWRRFSLYSSGIAGLPAEAETLRTFDGDRLLWEARFEVCLVPQVDRMGTVVPRGETAPADWLTTDAQNRMVVTMDNVDPDEFDAVARKLAPVFEKKTDGMTGTSTPTAPASPNG